MADEQNVNPLELSDEDFLNAPFPEEEEAVVEEEEQESEAAPAAELEEEEESAEEETDPESADPDGEASEESAGEVDGDEEEESGEGESEEAEGSEAEAEESEGDPDPEKKEGEEESEPNYKELYEQVMAPFRANGKDMKAESIEDVRRLMSMGANYNKKMSGMKPHLQTLKMLDKQGLLDEGKLSFLIDLSKGNKEAIAKLLQDHSVDPLELNESENAEYKPGTYTVDEKEVELDDVLDEIKSDSPEAYSTTLDILGTKWDEASRKALVSTPKDIRILSGHIQSGIYARVTEEVERQRDLGRLEGMGDLQAYQLVGDAMHKQGKFNDLAGGQREPDTAPDKPATPKPSAPAKPKADDTARKNKKRAASPSKGRATNKTSEPDFNPLDLPDDEFEKEFDGRLL